MDAVYEYLFLFCLCATAGWLIEVVYRGFRHHKVVNPGFLTGCCLPIYGIGGVILYFLSGLRLRALPNEGFRVAAILLLAVLVMTAIELLGGLLSVKLFHVRLWDYSEEWMNYKGLICPKFSLFWGLICAGYFFFLYEPLHSLADGVVEVPLLVLVTGVYLGVFAVDLAHSLRLMQRVKSYAVRMRTLVNIDQLKHTAREHFRNEAGGRRHAPFNFYRMVNRYMMDMNGYREQIQRKWGDKK